MPSISFSGRRNTNEKISLINTPQRGRNKNTSLENSGGSNGSKNSNKAGKRKRREYLKSSESELESELEGCNLEDAIALERRLRKVAKTNSLKEEEMKKILQKFVKNEHVLALVTLKAEDELARERRESEQHAIIITDTPSVPKLTRSKARELNKAPAITLPALNEPPQLEITALIKDDLQSDEDDEEYIFKEEDFVSDDDPHTTVSDFDSNPCTPQTPFSQTEHEDSPVKLTSDGCFKIPIDKCDQAIQENMRIAARTRSKLCLQQTTIEDIQSEFVPPDVDLNETLDIDATAYDEDWMQFLNDFSKPLNKSLLGDDDDPINDPEYIAADKEQVDAEELRDVNISKKELTELVAELFEGLVNEGVSLESLDLETPQKFLENNLQFQQNKQTTPTTTLTTSRYGEVSRQIDFDTTHSNINMQRAQQTCVSDATISSTNITQNECSFQPDAISTPAFELRTNASSATLVPVAVSTKLSDETSMKAISIPDATNAPELIAVPVPGHPNHFHLAKILTSNDSLNNTEVLLQSQEKIQEQTQTIDDRYSIPYDNNFTCQYISIKRHVYSEYIEKFESLRNVQDISNSIPKDGVQTPGFTPYQHDILQQQLRIHVQMLTQTYIQTYSHPEFWKMAPQVRAMIEELHDKAAAHATFNAWNLRGSLDLINQWEQELSKDTEENKEFMAFMHKEIELTNRNTRQIPRFAPRIMDFILKSNVFMYPMYLPRIPFSPKVASYHTFSPSESLLIALGLDKHMRRIKESRINISKKFNPLIVACKYMNKDTIFGKTKRRIWDQVNRLRKASYYNPVKYYFEHNRAPPIEHQLITFENNTVLPPIQRYNELPLAWQNYIKTKNNQGISESKKNRKNNDNVNNNNEINNAFLDIVREAVGGITQTSPTTTELPKNKKGNRRTPKVNNVTINVNYVFDAGSRQGDVTSLVNSTTCVPQQSQIDQVTQSSSIIAYNYDYNLQKLEPVLSEITTPAGPKIETISKNKSNRSLWGRRNWRHFFNSKKRFGISRKRHREVVKLRQKRALKSRFLQLVSAYNEHLQNQELRYNYSPLILRYYKYFKALELYSELLVDLKMFCRNVSQSQASNGSSNRRARSEDEISNNTTVRSRRINRQEENLRNMLLPDSAEDANRKDAIYAFNFYERVEEVFKSANRPEDYEKFNTILKSFNPKCDRASDLYYKLEALFLPDYPELAEVFLTFLLPSEAAEIGKFFEHFMITNMTTFITKLNVYFNKQPAQIRKVYNCLSELSEEADITMKKVEERILPLLKGNQFLIDWFMQQFCEAPVPERLLSQPENVNLKEAQNNQSGEYMEIIKDILDSPTSDQQRPCQLRYINGRIFYGSKMTLPAKLSFMAKKCTFSEESSSSIASINSNVCLHGIREYGEQRLAAAAASNSNNINIPISSSDEVCNDENEKTEEDDLSKALIIDTTVASGEDDSCSSIEVCDDATMRSHALRLNPGYYGNSCFTAAAATSTPNIGNTHQVHHPNAKKQSLNFYDDIKMSPRKNFGTGVGTSVLQSEALTITGSTTSLLREKRKSPTKKIKSPSAPSKSRTSLQQQPMVVIHHERNGGPIAYAKKLKSLIDSNDEQPTSHLEQQSVKMHMPIIARAKQRLPIAIVDQSSQISDDNSHFVGKYENSDEMEFLPELTPPHKAIINPKMGFPRLQSHTDSSAEECSSSEQFYQANKIVSSIEEGTTKQQAYSLTYNAVSSTNAESDEDCKLDIVATLATNASNQQNNNITTTTTPANAGNVPLPIVTDAFTREEDKVILIEMKLGSSDRNDLLKRISVKLPNRTLDEISTRHQFLMDFLSKLQGKQ